MVSGAAQRKASAELGDPRDLALICKAAADPLRLDILRVLSRDSFGVQELASILKMPQPGMSHHLKVLAQSGLVVTRRQGNSIFYRRALLKDDGELGAFQSSLYAAVDAMPVLETVNRRISAVNKERAQHSREFFERNAGKFGENQAMLCEPALYLPNLRELLALMKLPKNARAMEIGPGQGELLKELGRRFDSIVALDNSGEMLALTEKKLGAKYKNIEFVNGSLEAYDAQTGSFDAVVLNMVMHHLPSPAAAFTKLRQLVRAGGYILIADLCSHDQQWASEACGDVWMGFDPQDLNAWASSAGFEENQSSYLGLKNGFQIQLKLFRAV